MVTIIPIMRSFSLPERWKCIDEEIPFEIPNGWQWERIGNIFETTSGSTPLSRKPDYYKNGNINWVRTTDLNNGILEQNRNTNNLENQL